MQLRFTSASRKHRVPRSSARQALANAVLVGLGTSSATGRAVYLFIGDDDAGRTLEVGIVLDGEQLVVIHVMEARPRHLAARQEIKEG